jgi:hypothetical protein
MNMAKKRDATTTVRRVNYNYYDHEQTLFREDPETLLVEGWDGSAWYEVLGTEDVTIRFDGMPITVNTAREISQRAVR